MINIFSLKDIKNAPNQVLQLLLVPMITIMVTMMYLFISIVFYSTNEICWTTVAILRLSTVGLITLFIVGHILENMGLGNFIKQ